MSRDAPMMRGAAIAVLALVCISATRAADAGCQVWNGCMHRVEKRLTEFRTRAQQYMDLSKKCIDVVSQEQSKVALYHPACLDAQSALNGLHNPNDDEDEAAHMTAEDRLLVYAVQKQVWTVRNLASSYETPAERETEHEVAAQRLADTQAEEARSHARGAAIIGALAAGAEQAANQQAARPPNYTCFTQQAPYGGGGTTTCLPH
jgi:hypothetical protein